VEAGGWVFNTEAHPIDPGIVYCCSEKRHQDMEYLRRFEEEGIDFLELARLTSAADTDRVVGEAGGSEGSEGVGAAVWTVLAGDIDGEGISDLPNEEITHPNPSNDVPRLLSAHRQRPCSHSHATGGEDGETPSFQAPDDLIHAPYASPGQWTSIGEAVEDPLFPE